MIKTEINDIETEKATEKMNVTRSRIFEKINKIENLLVRLTKKEKKHRLPISRMKRGVLLQTLKTYKE